LREEQNKRAYFYCRNAAYIQVFNILLYLCSMRNLIARIKIISKKSDSH